MLGMGELSILYSMLRDTLDEDRQKPMTIGVQDLS